MQRNADLADRLPHGGADEGVSRVAVTFASSYVPGQRPTYVATGTLNSLNPSWLRISMNPATGDGGTCYGDSGLNFLGAGATETDIVGGTTVTGDTWCRSTNVDYRLDTASARAFLGQYVALP